MAKTCGVLKLNKIIVKIIHYTYLNALKNYTEYRQWRGFTLPMCANKAHHRNGRQRVEAVRSLAVSEMMHMCDNLLLCCFAIFPVLQQMDYFQVLLFICWYMFCWFVKSTTQLDGLTLRRNATYCK